MINNEVEKTHQELNSLMVEVQELRAELNLMRASRSWKLAKPLRHIFTWMRAMEKRYLHLLFLLRTEGCCYVGSLVLRRLRFCLVLPRSKSFYKKELSNVLQKNIGKRIIVFCPVVDWNIPLMQRPQHIAKKLAEKDFLYFYCTPNIYDSVDGFEKISDGCYLTNQFELLMQLKERKIIHIYAADPNCKWEFIEERLTDKDIILYEYIDEIHSDIAGRAIDPSLLARHEKVIRHKDIICIVSADKLYRDVQRYRSENLLLVTNGVDIQHFSFVKDAENIPPEIEKIVNSKKPVIGYFGALAKWFDYELIIKLANERPNYEILLIGWNYDHSIEKYPMGDYPNITVIGPINYQLLPQYACWFNVSIIPFIINEVTESTSPVKLFEYMALGHPIVSTDMPECRKYKSALVAKSHNEFLCHVDASMQKQENADYMGFLHEESIANSWEAKALDIATMLNMKLSQN